MFRQEFGCPYELLREKPNGYFSGMVRKTGSQMAQSLREQAQKACEKNDNHRNLDLSVQNSSDSDTATTAEITDQITEESKL